MYIVPATPGYFYSSWPYYGVVFVTTVGLLYVRFLLSLRLSTRVIILSSGALFIVGALGVEMIAAASASGVVRLRFLEGSRLQWFVIVEETMELLALVLLSWALLRHARLINRATFG